MQILAHLKNLKRMGRLKFAGTLTALDPKPIDPRYSGVTVFAVCRNEIELLPHWFAHHRQLGAGRFFIVDNGSTDGSLDFLRAQPDVHLFTSLGSFRGANFGARWAEEIVVRFGLRGWWVFLDLDEFLIYPRCESVSLPALTRHLDAAGERALFAPLLDMYADQPITQARLSAERGPLEVCPFFDAENIISNCLRGHFPSGLHLTGGVRGRVFQMSVCLNKIPLIRMHPGVRLHGGWHFTSVTPVSRIQGAVLHFKFTEHFALRARVEAERGEHWRQAAEYRQYCKVLEAQPDLNLHCASSVRFESSQTLLDRGILKAPAAYWQPVGYTSVLTRPRHVAVPG